MTKAERINITGGAIAFKLRDSGHTGQRLDRAIEEVADDMTFRGLQGSTVVAESTLAEINESNIRDWNAVRREAKKALKAMGRPV